MAILDEARTYYRDLSGLSARSLRLILARWRRVDRRDIAGSWLRLLPDVAAIAMAAQTVAAELADPYLAAVLSEGGPPRYRVNPEAYAGATPEGQPVESLLYQPVTHALHDIGRGVRAGTALADAAGDLAMYARTLTADAGRLAVAAGMGARPDVTGYYRMLVPPSCARCAILAGRRYAVNQGFNRHPRCDCVHIPVREAVDDLALDARKAIEAGKVTGLSEADRRAIVEFGADPAQVVNARRGMYRAGGASFTTTGTTRRGVAGARLLARDLARAEGGITAAQGTFRNLTFDRLKAAQYAELLRKGTTFARPTGTGRVQTYAYRYARSRRLTPEQILTDATSREDAIRLLIDNGYII